MRRAYEGSGIGLALVQSSSVCTAGPSEVESAAAKGTAFTISVRFRAAHLPTDRSEARSRVSTSAAAGAFVEEALRWLPSDDDSEAPDDRADDFPDLPSHERTAGARIVVADDNSDMRNFVRRLLQPRWEIEAVSDGAQAPRPSGRRSPILSLTDVMMPGLDGFGLLRELRKDPTLRDIPVIMLSARAGEDARVEGLDAMADDYLTKPFSARELIARVNANLEMALLRRENDSRVARKRSPLPQHGRARAGHDVDDRSDRLAHLPQPEVEASSRDRPPEEALGFGAWEALHPDDRGGTHPALLSKPARRARRCGSNTGCAAATASIAGL